MNICGSAGGKTLRKLKNRILEDREERYEEILRLINEHRKPVLCAKVNIPGLDKNTEAAFYAFGILQREVLDKFSGNFDTFNTLSGSDGRSLIAVLNIDDRTGKIKGMEIEERHPLGRIFDIDVYGVTGAPLDRRGIEKESRNCIICGEAASLCIRTNSHDYTLLIKTFEEMICKFKFTLEDSSRIIGEAALYSILCEISASPTPGLISPHSMGSHRDMDYFTFLRSTSVISDVMVKFARIGLEENLNLLPKVREIGIEAEKRMFKATNGVNTQKGMLFLAGVLCCAVGQCYKKGEPWNRINIAKMTGEICKGLVENELKLVNPGKRLTNGERLFIEFGLTGIRGEIENGLPSVLNFGLPTYENALRDGLKTNDALVQALLSIMTTVDDTTVANRCGLAGVKLMRHEAHKALELGGMTTKEGVEQILEMEKIFADNSISPGGAADLLAVTAMIYELEWYS
jgi:triphosphoribosyl-dephospho-CoA synthase CitG/holo-ACP synthase CitX